AASSTVNSVSVEYGVAGGGFGSNVDFAAERGPASLVVAGFDGDGRLDLAVTNHDANTVSVLPGRAGGAVGRAGTYAVQPGSQPEALAIGDLDGDGHPDVVVGTLASGSLSVLLGQVGGTLGAAIQIGSGFAVAVQRFDGDAQLDLVSTTQ